VLATNLALFLADKSKYADFPPEFAIYCGWLCFILVLLVGALAWVRIESVRRFLFVLEDPRTMAVLRIGFALMTIACFLNLEPYWRMLWSDEGVLNLQYAQEKLGRQALRGWSPEEGFFDGWAIVAFLWSKPSLLYFWGSPDFVVGYMLVFFFVLVLYGAGVFTRTTGILAWFLMSGIYNRNALYWEGTDTVYRCFWLILLFAKTGHAWSFDNWWRCRRLRNKGRLEHPDAAPDEDQSQLEPIYRKVPAWPRYLFMLQLAALYCTTGSVKTGSVWAKGDALYYALNMDHFYRFEWITQQISAVFSTTLFRLNTWVTHWWERLFPLVLIGVSLSFTLRHKHEAWYRERDTVWRRWGARLLLISIWGLAWRINYLVLPFCLAMVGDKIADPSGAILKIHIAWGIVIPTFVLAWYALGRWPVTLLRRGRAIPWVTDRIGWLYIPELHLDQDNLRAWLLGRRVWLTLGFMFHGALIAFMNIGMFAFIMLMTYAAFLRGEETNRICGWLVGLLARTKGVRALVPKNHARFFVPAKVNPVEDDSFTALAVALLVAAGVLSWLVATLIPGLSFEVRRLGEQQVGSLVFAVLLLVFAALSELRGHRSRLFSVPTTVLAALYLGYQADAYLGTVGLLAGAALAIALRFEVWRRGVFLVSPHPVRGRKVPDLVVLLFGLMGVGLIWAKVDTPEWIDDLGRLAYGWMALIAFTALVFRFLPPRAAQIRRAHEPGPTLAYGALGRSVILLAVVYHAAAVGTSLFPKYPILNKWRGPAASVFGGWLRGTGTSQSWRMFAPNPPRSNTFLKTVVVEQDGDRWDLRNNAFHYRPNPWIWNDRMRKMQRRMAGKGKWYLRYWSAWQCREWTLKTGEMPYEIDISKLITKIPPPDAVHEKGPYHPRKLKVRERHIQTHKCKGDGELPLVMLERYGMAVTDEDRQKAEREEKRHERKFNNRRTTWENRRDWGAWENAEEQERKRRERADERREKRAAESGGSPRERALKRRERVEDSKP